MTRNPAIVPSLVAFVVALAGCADAQSSEAPARIETSAPPADPADGTFADAPGYLTGVVVDTELVPIPGVDVLVNPGEILQQTNHAGAFKIGPLEDGAYSVRAEKEGYNGTEIQVQVSSDKPARITLTIIPAATTVP